MYCFDDVPFNHSGRGELIAEVYDNSVVGFPRCVLKKAITVCTADLPATIADFSVDLNGKFPFGAEWKQLECKMLNANRQPVDFEGAVVVDIVCEEFPVLKFHCWDGAEHAPDPRFEVSLVAGVLCTITVCA